MFPSINNTAIAAMEAFSQLKPQHNHFQPSFFKVNRYFSGRYCYDKRSVPSEVFGNYQRKIQ